MVLAREKLALVARPIGIGGAARAGDFARGPLTFIAAAIGIGDLALPVRLSRHKAPFIDRAVGIARAAIAFDLALDPFAFIFEPRRQPVGAKPVLQAILEGALIDRAIGKGDAARAIQSPGNPIAVEGRAIDAARYCDRAACAAYGASFSWDAATRQFLTGLVALEEDEAVAQLARLADLTVVPHLDHDHDALFADALHAALFIDASGEIRLCREDIGRHNALDKLIGALLNAGIDGRQGFTVVTSRCSLELIHKALRAGIGTLVSLSAPTTLSVQWARQHNLNLIHLPQHSAPRVYSPAAPGVAQP